MIVCASSSGAGITVAQGAVTSPAYSSRERMKCGGDDVGVTAATYFASNGVAQKIRFRFRDQIFIAAYTSNRRISPAHVFAKKRWRIFLHCRFQFYIKGWWLQARYPACAYQMSGLLHNTGWKCWRPDATRRFERPRGGLHTSLGLSNAMPTHHL